MISFILTIELQGKSFLNGVRFSVHIISGGKLEYLTKEGSYEVSDGMDPSGRKEYFGLAVLVSSIKFKDEQNWPERILVNFFQFEGILKKVIEDQKATYFLIKEIYIRNKIFKFVIFLLILFEN